MQIADAHDVERAYPNVQHRAVVHLMWALHRVVPLMEAGRTEDGVRQLRSDLAGYPGSYDDFEPLGVRAIFTAAGHGRHDLANQLGELRLLALPRTPGVHVLIGDVLAARLWAAKRCLGSHQWVYVRDGWHACRILGLDARRTVLVFLDDEAVPDELDRALQMLIAGGAQLRDPGWHPSGADPDAGRSRLRV